MSNKAIEEKLKHLPSTPGVYLFRAKNREILYIGKARELKKRVCSYFSAKMRGGSPPKIAGRIRPLADASGGQNRGHSPKIAVLVNRIHDLEIIETRTEVDALLLEAHLARKLEPRYNTRLKDDKSFPLLKLTSDRFPRLVITRSKGEKRAAYYGPYTDSRLLREAVRLLNGLFPIRKCRTLPKKACLYYSLGQCIAPCIKPEVKPEYDRLIKEIKTFLQGTKKSLMDYLAERMRMAASEFRFEDAQFFKEQIEAIGWFRKKRFNFKHPEGGIGLRGTLELKRALQLKRLPEKIICFDVSNFQGREAAASKACFYRELPNTLEYRRYKIKAVSGIDDYAMIREALGRMVRGVKEGRESDFPDLIMIDGGRGHLNAALGVLKSEGCEEMEIVSIAKRFEFIYSPKFKDPIVFSAGSSALRLLQKVRDEAHRFAITYHRSLKEKSVTRSLLDQIPGIGEKRKRLLLASFSSLEELRNIPIETLARMEGMNQSTAEKVIQHLHLHLPPKAPQSLADSF